MKGRHWFVVGIVAFLLLMFAIEYRLPKRFVWRPTFGHYDEQPFGCALFDSLVSVSASETYTLSRKTFYQLASEDTLNVEAFWLFLSTLHCPMLMWKLYFLWQVVEIKCCW